MLWYQAFELACFEQGARLILFCLELRHRRERRSLCVALSQILARTYDTYQPRYHTHQARRTFPRSIFSELGDVVTYPDVDDVVCFEGLEIRFLRDIPLGITSDMLRRLRKNSRLDERSLMQFHIRVTSLKMTK